VSDQQFSFSRRLVGVVEDVYRRVFWVIATLGLPPSFIIRLETEGRRSGRMYTSILLTANQSGERYLVSVLGDGSDWVRNVRAAGGRAAIRHGRRRVVRLEEVPTDQRPPILRAYLKWGLGARAVLELGPSSPIEEFQRIAPDHPTFRIIDAP
jgi:hypothetical protein